ncbi:GNAT family N-acetyltransferase [Uliginosibacterium paludis]|uniref:GNAT family N-acetyltransferase n=1 Tax=Uliginosibacterium paludis TaxID=1615952 RepID=A0ABV2CWK7_9RHOO
MDIRRIPWQSSLALRRQVLWPEASLEAMKLDDDEAGLHFGAHVDGALVSVASVFIDGDEARLRKFATAAAYQRRGIGSAVLRHLLDQLREAGCRSLWCDARESALAFYRRFGLHEEGPRFHKEGLPYFRMRISLCGAGAPHAPG